MTILRTGSNDKYAHNWSAVFGGKKSQAKSTKSSKKSAKKATTKKSSRKKARR